MNGYPRFGWVDIIRFQQHDKERAGYGLEQIGMLYNVETIADEEGASYERRKTAGNRT